MRSLLLALVSLVLAAPVCLLRAAEPSCDTSKCVTAPSPVPPPPQPSTVTLSLGDNSIARVDKRFVSFTFDSSQWRALDLTGSKTTYGSTLDVLVRGLLPAHLRVGGTQGDYDIYTGFDNMSFPTGTACAHLPKPMTAYRCQEVTRGDFLQLLAFCDRNNLTLVYGLNDMFGRPTKSKGPEKPLCGPQSCPAANQTNLNTLISYIGNTKPIGFDKIAAFELGNELNSCLNGSIGAKTQAADFAALRKLVDAAWRSHEGNAPLLVGPDTHSSAEFQASGVEWFSEFVKTAESVGDIVDFHTFHMYSLGNGPRLDPLKLDASYLSASSLNRCGEGVRALQEVIPLSKRGRLWAGETAAANQGGRSGITDTYIDGFWYLDQLGQLAALNVSVFLRQTMVSHGGYPLAELVDTSLRPLPDYWVALLHKKLMGEKVLNVTSSGVDVRAYCHCGVGGGVTLALLNIALNKTVTITLPAALANEDREEFILTAGTPIDGAVSPLQSKTVKLNGKMLELGPESHSLPHIEGKVGKARPTIELAPTTFGFVRFPRAQVKDCRNG